MESAPAVALGRAADFAGGIDAVGVVGGLRLLNAVVAGVQAVEAVRAERAAEDRRFARHLGPVAGIVLFEKPENDAGQTDVRSAVERGAQTVVVGVDIDEAGEAPAGDARRGRIGGRTVRRRAADGGGGREIDLAAACAGGGVRAR